MFNDHEITAYHNLWDTVTVWKGKFIALNAYVRKEERSHIDNLSTYLKKLEKEEQNKHKANKRKEKK